MYPRLGTSVLDCFTNQTHREWDRRLKVKQRKVLFGRGQSLMSSEFNIYSYFAQKSFRCHGLNSGLLQQDMTSNIFYQSASHSWNQCWHFRCFNIKSDVFREISDVWYFGDKSDVDGLLFLFSTFPLRLGWKEVKVMSFKFLSPISHPRVCLVIVQTEEAHFTALKITFCVAHDRLLHLMTTLRSVSDSMWVIALWWVLVMEAFSLYQTVS